MLLVQKAVSGGEVETGDTAASGDYNVYGVFYVEADPVYAEWPVEINFSQLQDRCLKGPSRTTIADGTNQSTPDNDGNAAFTFSGRSCAARSSQVVADVLAGDPPRPTPRPSISIRLSRRSDSRK